MIRTIALACLLAGAALLPLAAQADASTNKSCAWLVEPTADRENILYPEITTRYLAAIIPALPGGGYVEVKGQFPHARYMSLQTYTATLQTISDLHDTQIQPDAGSTNPFIPGADRNAAARDYTVKVVLQQAPASGAPANTLYYIGDSGSRAGDVLVYRIYLPDDGDQPFGAVPAPSLTEVLPGGVRLPIPTCPDLVPDTSFLTEELAAAGLSDYPLPAIGLFAPKLPTWQKFQNVAVSEVNILTDNQILGTLTPPLAALAAKLPAGFAENADNKYVSSLVSREYGDVVSFRARLPITPKTYDGQATMGSGQMRFWSMCTGDVTTQTYACVVDKDMPLDGDGYYTVAISTASDRPANATPQCGVAWLPWGPTVQAGVIMRNMLPQDSFPYAVQDATPGTEQQTLGPYYPLGTYYASAKDFDNAVGCHAPATPADQQGAPSDGGEPGGSGSGGGAFTPQLLLGLLLLQRVKSRRRVQRASIGY